MEDSNGSYEVGVVKMFHDDAYAVIERALSLDESDRGDEVRSLYEDGIRLLEQALSVKSDRPEHVGENWDKVRLLQMKMRKTREDVISRMSTLAKERPDISFTCPDETYSSDDMPPSYEEALEGNNRPPRPPPPKVKGQNGLDKSLHNACQGLNPQAGVGKYTHVPPEASVVFHIANGAQLFFVSRNGEVSAPSYPTALHIYKIEGTINEPSSSRTQMPPAFLQVGEWIYPLIPGQMPVLHTAFGAYMLPDTNSDVPGSAIGLLLSDGVSQQERQIFEHLMCELTALKAETVILPREGERRMSTKISDGLVTGAEMLSKGMMYGAEKTSEYIKYAANKLRENMEPVSNPTYVDPKVQKGLQMAKSASDVAVKVSGYLINQLGRATMALGQQLAPHIRKQGAALIAKAMGEEEPQKADQTMNSVLEVAAGGLKGFSTVYMGLQDSAKILANSLISETVTTVNYKYGAEAATSTGDGLHTLGNVAYTSYNVSHLGIKAIAKKTATSTGKALIMQSDNEKATTSSASQEDLNKKS